MLHTKDAVRELLAAQSAESLRESFLRYASGESVEGAQDKRMVCVYVQEEGLFQEIIEIFAGIRESSTVVVRTESLQTHLTKLPLFQGLWQQDPGGFSNLLISIVDKRLTNEVLRQIETRTGDLSARTGVLVTVQDLAYAAGSLAQ